MKSFSRALAGLVILFSMVLLFSGCPEMDQGEAIAVEAQEGIEVPAEAAEPVVEKEVEEAAAEPEIEPAVETIKTTVEAAVAEPVEEAVTEPAGETVAETVKPEPAAVAETVKPEPAVEVEVAPAEPKPAEAIAEKTEVMVTVNGVDITESEVEKRVAPQVKRLSARLPANMLEQYKPKLMQQATESLIVESLLNEKVKSSNIVITEAEVIEHLTKTGARQATPVSLDQIKSLIESQGGDFEEVKQGLKRRLGYQKLVESQFTGQMNFTEEDARKHYDENPKQFETPEQVKASHILIVPDANELKSDPNAAKAKATAKAEQLLKQVQDGENFAGLAKANSACGSASSGGDLKFGVKGDLASGRRGTWVKPFEDAAFGLKVGQVSDVVETQFGYHIIMVTDRKEASVVAFEEAKEDIIDMLTNKKKNELGKGYIDSLREQATIVYPAGKEPPAAVVPGGLGSR